jgi:hypothetical protein
MKANNYYQGYALGFFLSEGYQLPYDQALQALRNDDSDMVTPCEDFEDWDYGYIADSIEHMAKGLEHDFIPRGD